MRKVLKCSFCGRPETEVSKLVAGTGGARAHAEVYICDRCVEKAKAVMADAEVPEPGSNGGTTRLDE